MSNTTRRAVLNAAPVVAAALPALAGEGETEIARLYAEWIVLWTESIPDDDEANRRAEYRFIIEDRAAVVPVTSVRDLAMKVLMAAQNGEGMFPEVAEELRTIANAQPA